MTGAKWADTRHTAPIGGYAERFPRFNFAAVQNFVALADFGG